MTRYAVLNHNFSLFRKHRKSSNSNANAIISIYYSSSFFFGMSVFIAFFIIPMQWQMERCVSWSLNIFSVFRCHFKLKRHYTLFLHVELLFFFGLSFGWASIKLCARNDRVTNSNIILLRALFAHPSPIIHCIRKPHSKLMPFTFHSIDWHLCSFNLKRTKKNSPTHLPISSNLTIPSIEVEQTNEKTRN